tara:strand:- start:39 stop:455 length:417 start_codon:yes stop_codon:yes gene_type:complete
MSKRGAILENHEVTAINTVIGKQGYYKKEINSIMRDANKLTYTGPDGTVYTGFQNIIQAQRRGMIGSDVLDIAKFANIYTRLKQAYIHAKGLAEESLPELIQAGIREREYKVLNSNLNQQRGNLNQVLEGAELLNMAK